MEGLCDRMIYLDLLQLTERKWKANHDEIKFMLDCTETASEIELISMLKYQDIFTYYS